MEAKPFQTADTWLSVWVNHILGRMSQLVSMTSHEFLEIEGVWGEQAVIGSFCLKSAWFALQRPATERDHLHPSVNLAKDSLWNCFQWQMKLVKSIGVRYPIPQCSSPPHFPPLVSKKLTHEKCYQIMGLFSFPFFVSHCSWQTESNCKIG